MVQEQEGSTTQAEAGEASEVVSGGFAQSLLDVFIDPMKVFKRIEAGLTWWKPFVVAAVISMINGYLMIPFQTKRIALNPRDLPPEQVEAAMESTAKYGVYFLFLAPIGILIVYLIVAGISHLMINLMTSKASFKKTLSLISYLGIISILGQLVTSAVLLAKGVDSIETMADLKVSFSLSALMPEVEGAGYALMESLSVFNLWYYVLFLIGTATIFKMDKSKAIVPVIVLWVLSFLFAFLGSIVG
jgi:hypothetical protein